MGYIENPISVSNVGWQEDKGLRQEMEDGYVFIDGYVFDDCSFFGIYDGHGGQDCMQYCVDFLHQNIYVELMALYSKNEEREAIVCTERAMSDALVYAYKLTDVSLLDVGIEAGATACTCLLINQQPDPNDSAVRKMLYTAHLGDSRAILCRGGLAQRLTSMTDHKASCPIERKRIHKNGGTIVQDRVNGMLAIARAFGDKQLKCPALSRDLVLAEPDVTCVELESADLFIIVACDGLWDVVLDQEAVNIVLEGLTEFRSVGLPAQFPQKSELCARLLIEEALRRGSSDNITVQIVFF